ncbi:hypothetical protein QYH69_29340 [Paraburkholderia sp. SARCC-3016]|uniref:hypothetical protein n=1 Tax=Paraburkholderia sp. SARCC-3016 TaxID=3058611 RepID=UPI0028097BC6|nr:hypothetical protein [Paraburkholderia sp. SARCC-3016]MDQ7981340.1 hypothetical protein [Paraburkholderia sp. SARCC-3016]
MEANDRMKYALVVLAFAAWGALVVLGKAAPDRYVDALAISITGLGVHGATKRRAKGTASELDATAAPAANAPAAVQ